MKRNASVQLAQLVDMGNVCAVLEEVKYNFIQYYPIAAFDEVRTAFRDFNDLYDGKYPGYRACNTKFHDKIHTTDALLAISRLIDGYNIENRPLPVTGVKIALIATIFHDSGYLQKVQDTKGTGAKYTLNHVQRSVEFIDKYFEKIGFSKKDYVSAKNIVNCTGLNTNLTAIKFFSGTDRTLGYMLGAADLLGQMASRTYLERLLHLYKEFKEGNVKGYDSEYNLLFKTLKFQADMKKRIKDVLGGVDRYAQVHFRARYRINANLYTASIYNHIKYLKEILKDKSDSYRHKLKRQI